MTWTGILENLASDVIWPILAAIIGSLVIHFTRRKALLDFFGAKEQRQLLIYLSNIRVIPFGAIDIRGLKISYQGKAVAYGEMRAALRLQSLFRFFVPALAEASQTIGRILLSDTSTEIVVSPVDKKDLDLQAPLIAVGSSVSNVASFYIEQTGKGAVKYRAGSALLSEMSTPSPHPKPIAHSDTDMGVYGEYAPIATPDYLGGTISVKPDYETSLPDEPPPKKSEPSAILMDGLPPITDTDIGLIQRTTDSTGRKLFYASGLSEYATVGAATYLAAHWLDLNKRFEKDQSFLVLIKFTDQSYQNCSIVLERKL